MFSRRVVRKAKSITSLSGQIFVVFKGISNQQLSDSNPIKIPR